MLRFPGELGRYFAQFNDVGNLKIATEARIVSTCAQNQGTALVSFFTLRTM